MEMLTKIRAVTKIKSGIFFQDFEKSKKHGALRNLISEGSMFFQNLKKKCTFCFFKRPNPRKSALSRALKVTVWKVTKSLFQEQSLIILHEIT